MAMPNNLILIRHGESEGNVASNLAKQGDESKYTDTFVTTPGRTWNLTEKGQEQAKVAGEWIQNTVLQSIDKQARADRHYVSPYVRTKQTAGLLGLQDPYLEDKSPRWLLNRTIRERDWGDIDSRPKSEFKNAPVYELSALKKENDPLYWRPPGGESIVDVAENRVRNFLDTLHRECSGQTVIAVSHGEFIRATRVVLERIDDETYMEWEDNPAQKIANCEVFHYSRTTPEGKELDGIGTITSHRINWLRRSKPVYDENTGEWSMQVGEWERIDYDKPTNDQLLAGLGSG